MQSAGWLRLKLSRVNPFSPSDRRAGSDFAPTQVDPHAAELTPEDWPGLGEDSSPLPLDLMPAPVESDPTIGHVGRYALKRRIGEGGLGRVYTAWDPILSRNLAIKTVQLASAGVHRNALNTMILDEARAVASLNHPNIVTVYDAGLSDMGVYIAMEQLPGSDLRRLLADGWRPDPTRSVKLMRRVAEALAFAHAKGVIHCDIKPANIFMIDRRKPKVLDFGIARVAHRSDAPVLDGLITGSPHYLAPEQLRGETPDARTDVYAMGVVLYELLAGRKPFTGHSIQEIAAAAMLGRPTPVHRLVPGVPQELSAIVSRAMAPDPELRYGSARAMAMALRMWQARASTSPVPMVAAGAMAMAPMSPGQPAELLSWTRVATATTLLVALSAAAVWWRLT